MNDLRHSISVRDAFNGKPFDNLNLFYDDFPVTGISIETACTDAVEITYCLHTPSKPNGIGNVFGGVLLDIQPRPTVQEIARRAALGNLADELVNGSLGSLNLEALEAPELLAAVQMLREQRENLKSVYAQREEQFNARIDALKEQLRNCPDNGIPW